MHFITFKVGDKVDWQDPSIRKAQGLLHNRYGKGPFQVLEVTRREGVGEHPQLLVIGRNGKRLMHHKRPEEPARWSGKWFRKVPQPSRKRRT